MIPIHKLKTLPRHQLLRKIIKILEENERRLSSRGQSLSILELSYLSEILELLTKDISFSPEMLFAIKNASETFAAQQNGDRACENTDTSGDRVINTDASGDRVIKICRPINIIRHLLLHETGKQTADWDFMDYQGRLDTAKRKIFPGMTIFLEDIRSPYNVGSIFRTAESFGAEKLWLSPFCADPDHPRARRSAMGCTEILSWQRCSLETLEGPLFALETGGTELGNFTFPQKATMIIGSEELGVSPEALTLADASMGRLSIPTYGAKGSLNVSVAFGIALYGWAKQLC